MDESIIDRLLTDSDDAAFEEAQNPSPHKPAKPDPVKQQAQPATPAGPPVIPTNVKDTGLSAKFLNALLLKSLHILGGGTSAELAQQLKLSAKVVEELLAGLRQQGSVEVLGAAAANVPVLRYGLTNSGKNLASEASQQCEYVGPAPVSLAAFQEQVTKQSITGERVTERELCDTLSHLVLPDQLLRKLGPAVNSSRAILIYGPPGNGKTSISESIGKVFKQPIYVPYCFEVDGQVIRMFDPTVHQEIPSRRASDGANASVLRKKPDPRWIKCRRPILLMGGELTLDMLDLRFDATSKFYEAPPQIKALGGVFIIDDFGRQLVQPKDLLNRWIIPLERRVDFLTIHTGKKLEVPFDEMVIFSTNIPPNDLMDAALLRRVKYKFRIDPPTTDDYVLIFRRLCKQQGLQLPESILVYLLEDFYPRTGTACAAYHPGFFVEHAIATCRYEGIAPNLTIDLVKEALENLFVSDSPQRNESGSAEQLFQAKVS